MIYKKYVFNNKEQAESKIDAFFELDEEENKVQKVNASFINLGKFVLVEGKRNEDGEEIIAPILSEGWSVDVLWNDISDTTDEDGVVTLGQSPYGWKSYEINPVTPMHKIF